jgi:hypothetical protein
MSLTPRCSKYKYTGVGFFEHAWNNPPPPFNPDFDPKARARWAKVSQSMEDDDYSFQRKNVLPNGSGVMNLTLN